MSVTEQRALSDQFARIGKALGNGRRLELLEVLAQGERSVESLAGTTGLSVANTSQHLQHLRQAGLIIGRKAGQHVYYTLADDRVMTLLGTIRELAEDHNSEVARLVNAFLDGDAPLEPMEPDLLLEQARQGLITVVDVRPPEEYRAGHIDGAINIPLAELQDRLPELNDGRPVVAYCRGPYCLMGHEAVRRLRQGGVDALRLREGYPEWRQQGRPVAIPATEPGSEG